ncbi:hypothetical protein [Bacillus sp. 1P06AnD]|uniref:hypothetical protein n=1 Tax=Bacillus sp. 1P06AnD TaxID=3132208 RepID=UPI0039A39066
MKILPMFKLTCIIVISFICSFIILYAITAMLGFKLASSEKEGHVALDRPSSYIGINVNAEKII